MRVLSGAAAAGRNGRARTTPAGPRADQSGPDRRLGGRDPPRFSVKNNMSAAVERTRRRRRPGRARFSFPFLLYAVRGNTRRWAAADFSVSPLQPRWPGTFRPIVFHHYYNRFKICIYIPIYLQHVFLNFVRFQIFRLYFADLFFFLSQTTVAQPKCCVK